VTAPPSFEPVTEGAAPGAPPSFAPETEDDAAQREFGTPARQLETGTMSFLDMLSGGAASALAVGNSKRPEETRRIARAEERANPKARIAGDVLGILAPALVTGGASAPAQAAELTAPALIARAGRAVAGGVGRALPAAETLLGRVATKAATAGAQGLTEGALFGAQNVLHREVLQDPSLTAQSALAEVGLSSLFGGGLSVGGGVLGQLAKESVGAGATGRLGEWLAEMEGNRNLKAAGAIQSDISNAAKRVSREELNRIGREAGDMGLVGPFSTPKATFEKASEAMEGAWGKMRGILDAADGMPNVTPIGPERLVKRVLDEVVAPLEKNPLEAGTAQQMKGVLEGYRELFSTPEGLSFSDLHTIRKQISDKLYGLRGTADPNATALKEALHDFRSIVSDELDQGLAKVAPETKAAWKAANREYQVAATVQRFAEKGMDRALGNNPLGLLSVILGASGLATHGVPGGAAMAIGAEVAKRFGSGLAGAGLRAVRMSAEEGALSALAKSNEAVSKRILALSRAVATGTRAEVAPRLADSVIQEQMQAIQRFAGNPELAQEHLSRATESVQEHAPQVAYAMQVTAAQAASFLAQKVPAQPLKVLGPKMEQNEFQKWAFGRQLQAVEQPTSMLAHAANGTLTPLDVEAVKTVHPALFVKMQEGLLGQIMNQKGKVPYRSRLMLSMVLGQDVDGTLAPKSVAQNQVTYAMPSQKSPENQAGPMAAKPKPNAIKAAERTRLPGQAREERAL
jgi:hypothetical protein